MRDASYLRSLLTCCITALPTVAGAANFALEEVVVTAQKKPEGLQEAPLSISALSAKNLEALKLHNATEIASQIPNVTITTPYAESQPSFSVRGVSMSDFSQNQSSPIAMYVDEVYKGVGALQALQLFDLERIEVLRGPQGTLYGKNATGGAVNVISRGPQLSGDNNAYISAGIGNFSRFESEGATDLTLSQNQLGLRVAYTYSQADGWVDNSAPQGNDAGKLEDYAIRLTLQYEPRDNLSATLRYSKARSNQPDGYEVLASNIGPGGVGFFTGYDRSGVDFFESALDRDSGARIENESLSLTINWDLSEQLNLTSISSYDEGDWLTREDADGSPFNILHSDYGSEVRSIAQDFRLASDFDGPFNFLLGLYGHHEDLDADVVFRTYYAFAGDANNNGTNDCLEDFATGCRNSNSLNQVKNSLAAYFQGTYDITDKLSLTAGLRYTKDKTRLEDYDADIGFFDPINNVEVLSAFPTVSNFSDSVEDSKWGTRIALDYHVNDGLTTYLSFTTGYRNSAFNGQAFFDASEITIADPEEVDAWEVGFKADLLEDTLRINGATFYYRYENQQFLDVTPQILQILVNADEAQVFGAEVEISAIVTSNLELNMGLGYLDTEYTELNLRGQDLSGNELINAPDLNFNARLNWNFAQWEMGNFYLMVDTVFTDDQYFDAFNTETAKQDDYWLTNARLSFTNSQENLDLGLWVKNITDEEYLTSLLDLQSFFNFDYSHRGRSRTFGLDLKYRF
jgi:iron complex outermembrane recepter protein